MSLSKPRISNKRPVAKYIKWNGGKAKGYFSYYDKDKKEDIQIELKNLIVLDQDVFSITGYKDRDKTSYQSNEVRTVNDLLKIVQWKDKSSKDYKQGTYKELKEEIKDSTYLNYTKCVYAMMDGEPVHIQLKGNAAWSFGKPDGSGSYESHYVHHTSTELKQDKEISYQIPKFEFGKKFLDEDFEKAIEFDRDKLQPYLEAYFAGTITKEVDDINQDHPHEDDPVHEEASKKPSFDPKQWRNFEYDGKKLGQLKYGEIKELNRQEHDDSDLNECLGQAIFDYQQAEKNWQSVKDQSGRKITDYSLEELYEAYKKIPFTHPSRIKIEFAITEAEAAQSFADEDDIPF